MAIGADLLARVFLDTDDANRKLKDFGKSTESLSSRLEKAAPAGQAMAGAGALITGGFVGAIAAAASFDEQLNALKAVMSPADVEKYGAAVEQLALDLGKDTSFNAKEAALGLTELVKAGVPMEAVLGGAGRAAVLLAEATGIGLGEAAEVASSAMNAFGRPATDLVGIVDHLAGVANVSAADMADLRLGMQQSSAVAAMMGLSMEDNATAIGLMSQNGIKGSDAGTSLKTMLLNLQPVTKAQTKAFKKLGIITEDGSNAFFDAQGNAKDLAGISEVLQRSIKGMSRADATAVLEQAFGTDAVRAAFVLAKEGAAGVNDLNDAAGGITAAGTVAQRMSGLSGALKQFSGSLETAAINLGKVFSPSVIKALKAGERLLDTFSDLPDETKKTVAVFTALAGAALSLAGGFVLLAPFLASLPGAFAALSPLLGPLAGLLGLVAAAWIRDWGGIRSFISEMFGDLDIRAGLTELGNQFIGAVRAIDWPAVWETAKAEAMATLSTVVLPVADWLGEQWAAIDWGAVWRRSLGLGTGLLGSGLNIRANLVQWLGQQFQNIDWGAVWNAAVSIGTGLINARLGIAVHIGQWLMQQWAQINWADVWANATTLGQGLLDSALSIIEPAKQWLMTQWTAIPWADVWATATGIGTGLLQSALSIAGDLTLWLSAQWRAVDWGSVWAPAVSGLGGGLGQITQSLSQFDAFGAARSAGQTVGGALGNATMGGFAAHISGGQALGGLNQSLGQLALVLGQKGIELGAGFGAGFLEGFMQRLFSLDFGQLFQMWLEGERGKAANLAAFLQQPLGQVTLPAAGGLGAITQGATSGTLQIGQIVVQNEADENRLVAKIAAILLGHDQAADKVAPAFLPGTVAP